MRIWKPKVYIKVRIIRSLTDDNENLWYVIIPMVIYYNQL